MKLLVGIPAFNEDRMIGKAIRSLPKKIRKIDQIDLLVVDDGSTDRTADKARKAGATVLTHLINRGLGGALKTIFAYSRVMNYDILVTFDADGQHDGKDLPKIISPLLNKNADVVIGTRWKRKKNRPWLRRLVNQGANFITYLLFGIYCSDSQSGYRAFNRNAILKINIVTDGMEVSSEFFKEINRNKLHVAEVPTTAIYTDYSQSKGQRISDAPDVLFKLMLRFLE